MVLLEIDSSLLPYDPGQQIQILPSILDRIKMVASIIRPNSIMQTEMIVGHIGGANMDRVGTFVVLIHTV